MRRASLAARLWLLLAVTASLVCLAGCDGECHHFQMNTEQVLPDCSKEGYTLHSCTECSYQYKSDFVAPTGHTLTSQTTAPTCTVPGHTDYRCACGYGYTSDTVPPLGHHYVSETRDASCTAEGYTTYLCQMCGLSYRAEHVAPTGHDFTVTAKGPTTCTQTAYTEYNCKTCGYTYIGDYLFYSDMFEGAYADATEPLAHGVDISYHNHETDDDGNYLPLDFTAIREAGFDFVILRAGSTPRTVDGEAKGGIDPVFEMNYAAAREAGLDIGVYFYTYSTTVEDTVNDAKLLMEWLEGKTLEYPVFFDAEEASIAALSRREATELCLSFISTLQENRYFAALYVNNNWLMNELQTDKITFLLDVWYARYPSGDGPYAWDAEKYGDQLGMWQYTQSGIIPAISETTAFDFNYAYKDYPAIIQSFGYNGHGEN